MHVRLPPPRSQHDYAPRGSHHHGSPGSATGFFGKLVRSRNLLIFVTICLLCAVVWWSAASVEPDAVVARPDAAAAPALKSRASASKTEASEEKHVEKPKPTVIPKKQPTLPPIKPEVVKPATTKSPTLAEEAEARLEREIKAKNEARIREWEKELEDLAREDDDDEDAIHRSSSSDDENLLEDDKRAAEEDPEILALAEQDAEDDEEEETEDAIESPIVSPPTSLVKTTRSPTPKPTPKEEEEDEPLVGEDVIDLLEEEEEEDESFSDPIKKTAPPTAKRTPLPTTKQTPLPTAKQTSAPTRSDEDDAPKASTEALNDAPQGSTKQREETDAFEEEETVTKTPTKPIATRNETSVFSKSPPPKNATSPALVKPVSVSGTNATRAAAAPTLPSRSPTAKPVESDASNEEESEEEDLLPPPLLEEEAEEETPLRPTKPTPMSDAKKQELPCENLRLRSDCVELRRSKDCVWTSKSATVGFYCQDFAPCSLTTSKRECTRPDCRWARLSGLASSKYGCQSLAQEEETEKEEEEEEEEASELPLESEEAEEQTTESSEEETTTEEESETLTTRTTTSSPTPLPKACSAIHSRSACQARSSDCVWKYPVSHAVGHYCVGLPTPSPVTPTTPPPTHARHAEFEGRLALKALPADQASYSATTRPASFDPACEPHHRECGTRPEVTAKSSSLRALRYKQATCCQTHPHLKRMIGLVGAFLDESVGKDAWWLGPEETKFVESASSLAPWSTLAVLNVAVFGGPSFERVDVFMGRNRSTTAPLPMTSSKHEFVKRLLAFNKDSAHYPYTLRACASRMALAKSSVSTATYSREWLTNLVESAGAEADASDAIKCYVVTRATSIPASKQIEYFELSLADAGEPAPIVRIVPRLIRGSCVERWRRFSGAAMQREDEIATTWGGGRGDAGIPIHLVLPAKECRNKLYETRVSCARRVEEWEEIAKDAELMEWVRNEYCPRTPEEEAPGRL